MEDAFACGSHDDATLSIAVVEGSIHHRRTRPVAHDFAYRAFCLRLPLSALDQLPALGIARNARGAVAFDDRDHGARDGTPLQPWIRALLRRERIDADGEVVLYTFPRMLGCLFNPVSFWVCHDRLSRVRAVLVEVNNTFGERHNYLVAHSDGRAMQTGETLSARKVFHVSPFCEVTGDYRFRFRFGASRWLARIDYFDASSTTVPVLATSISGTATTLAPGAALRLLWRHRWFTAGVIVRIHWQAAALWAKRVPLFRKPSPPATLTTR